MLKPFHEIEAHFGGIRGEFAHLTPKGRCLPESETLSWLTHTT